MLFTCTPLGALFTFPSSGPLSFEAGTTILSDEGSKACSTLAGLPHKPSADEREENRRTAEVKKKWRTGWRLLLMEGREEGSAGPLLRPATLYHQAANDG